MDLNERLKALIDTYTSSTKRYKELEELTGIPSATWKTYYSRGVRPSADLIEAVAKLWPQHAFWLITGATDNEFSHTSPKAESQLDVPYQSRPAGEEYLKLRVEISAKQSQPEGTLIERFEDWLTEHQEKGAKRWPWLYSVHPKLAARKLQKETMSLAQSELFEDAVTKLHAARNKRIAEFKAINDDQGS